MDKPRIILGSALIAIAGGIGLYASQSATRVAPGLVLHQNCGTSQDADVSGKSHVPDHFAKALELTSAQLADIDRLSAELCQTMARAHDNMMNVLTTEQREKMAKLHEGGHAGGIHAFMKKLHGGK